MSEIKDRPILMSAPMVRAILEGRKTQTRRLVKHPRSTGALVCVDYGDGWWPYVSVDGESFTDGSGNETAMHCPYGRPGDRLWVKEAWTGTWHPTRQSDTHLLLHYRADGAERFVNAPGDYVLPKAAAKVGNWVTPLFMPRWASRITLEITEVRVQRLQDVSEEDCIAEGLRVHENPACKVGVGRFMYTAFAGDHSKWALDAKTAYRELWESINGTGSWDANPWVWAVSFKYLEGGR